MASRPFAISAANLVFLTSGSWANKALREPFPFCLRGLSFLSHAFSALSELSDPKSTWKNECSERRINARSKNNVKCAFTPTHNISLMWLQVPWTRLGRSWRWSSFPHLSKIHVHKCQLGIPSFKIHRWHGSLWVRATCHILSHNDCFWQHLASVMMRRSRVMLRLFKSHVRCSRQPIHAFTCL